MYKKYYTFFIFLVWSFLVIFYFHKGALGEEVRYYNIAEGNISHAIQGIWDQGLVGLASVLKSDAEGAGRIRPGHWLYYNIPFAFTLLRNGDMFRSVPDVSISQRINGDLQTHALFMILSLALACACISVTTWKLSSSIIAALLFPIYVASSFTICENLIVNHCDSQEIPQLLFIALYFLTISNLFAGKVIGWKKEILAIIFLVSAYATKETSILLMPAFLMVFCILWRYFDNASSEYRRSLLIQGGVHIFCFVFLLSLIKIFRSGEYSSTYYILKSTLIDRYYSNFLYSWNDLTQGVPWPWMAFVGLVGLALIVVYSRRKVLSQEFPAFLLLIVSFLLLIGFWTINIPWMHRMPKYYITVFFFASLFVIYLQVVVYKFFKLHGLHAAGVIWLAGTSLFMVQTIDIHKNRIDDYYTKNYWIRQSIPLIATDIYSYIHDVDANSKIAVIDGGKIRDGLLQLQRHVNLIHGINIAVDGKLVHRVRSHERNYFRINHGSPSVEIRMDSNIQDGMIADCIYVLDSVVGEDDTRLLTRLGYELSAKLKAGVNGPRVLKFTQM